MISINTNEGKPGEHIDEENQSYGIKGVSGVSEMIINVTEKENNELVKQIGEKEETTEDVSEIANRNSEEEKATGKLTKLMIMVTEKENTEIVKQIGEKEETIEDVSEMRNRNSEEG